MTLERLSAVIHPPRPAFGGGATAGPALAAPGAWLAEALEPFGEPWEPALEPRVRLRPVRGPEEPADLSWLHPALVRQVDFRSHRGEYVVRVTDQPGRWMDASGLESLRRDLRDVARAAMDEVPTYGVFTGARAAYANRVFAVAYERASGRPVGFTAMVYLPVRLGGRTEPAIHLGLTMIDRACRGRRIQTPLFKRIFWLPIANQRRLGFTITSIAASPAGIGAMSDYFQDVFPTYRRDTARKPFHLEVARQVLGGFRHEFGCSERARFDEHTFVVHGSNEPEGGGAHQFIKSDPVSRYRVAECNAFAHDVLDFEAGDEQLQVGRVHLVRGLWASRASRRKPGRPTP